MVSAADGFAVELADGDLLDEVRLTTDLIVAVANYDRHLDPDEVDRLIGLDRST